MQYHDDVEVESWPQYVARISAGASQKDIAAHTGIDASLVSRWLGGNQARPEFAVRFARAYRRLAVEALRALGLLTEDDVDVAMPPATSELSTDQLLAEISRLVAEVRRRVAAQSAELQKLGAEIGDDVQGWPGGYPQPAPRGEPGDADLGEDFPHPNNL